MRISHLLSYNLSILVFGWLNIFFVSYVSIEFKVLHNNKYYVQYQNTSYFNIYLKTVVLYHQLHQKTIVLSNARAKYIHTQQKIIVVLLSTKKTYAQRIIQSFPKRNVLATCRAS